MTDSSFRPGGAPTPPPRQVRGPLPRTAQYLVVSEVFGPTWQGEGPSLGRRCGFVRLGRCNLACTWCDTPYTWDWERYDPRVELHRRMVTEVVSELDAMKIDMVVISGGEPLLQQSHLPPLLAVAKERAWRIEVRPPKAGRLFPSRWGHDGPDGRAEHPPSPSYTCRTDTSPPLAPRRRWRAVP